MGADLLIRHPSEGRSLFGASLDRSPAQISQLSTVPSLTERDHKMITRRSILNPGDMAPYQDRGVGRTPGILSRIRYTRSSAVM